MKPRLRKDLFTNYHGVDCRFFHNEGQPWLERNDVGALQDGFVEKYPGRYYKNVSADELGPLFFVEPFVVYRGIEFAVMQVNNGGVILTSTDPALIKRFRMVRYEGNTYILGVRISDIDSFREEYRPSSLKP